MKTLKRVLGAAMVLALLFTCVGVASGGALRDDAGKTVSESAQAPAEPAPAEPISAPAAEDTPAGGQDAEEAGGAQDAGEPAGGEQETEEAGGGQDAGEPAGGEQETEEAGGTQDAGEAGDGQDAGEPAGGEQETEEPGGGQNAEEPAAGDKAALMSVSEPLPLPIANNEPIDAGNVNWSGTDDTTYTGNPISPVTATLVTPGGYTEPCKITYEGADGTDYTSSATPPTNAGKYTVTATWEKANGDTGTATKEFTINPAALTITLKSSVTRSYNGQNVVITGDDLESQPTLATGDTFQSLNIVTNQKDAGEQLSLQAVSGVLMATRGGGSAVDVYKNYTVTINNTITITAQSLTDAKVNFPDVVYNGEAQKVEPASVQLADETVLTMDYKVDNWNPEDAVNAGISVTVEVVPDGNNLTGNVTGEYTIQKLDLEKVDNGVAAGLTANEVDYDGNDHKLDIGNAVKATFIKGQGIPADQYDISYYRGEAVTDDFTKAGEITVKIEGKNNCTGTLTVGTFTIKPKPITEAMIAAIAAETYNGTEHTPEPVVTDGSKPLVKDTDYTVSYDNNTDAGVNTATVTVTGMGNYTGTASKTFTIQPKEVTITAAGQKLFGADDTNIVTDTVENPDPLVLIPTDNNWYQVVIDGLVAGETDKVTVTPSRVTGELPGEYDITLAITLTENTNGVSNYTVKGMTSAGGLTGTLTEEKDFTITTTPAFTVRVYNQADPSNEYVITTHDYAASYVIEAKDNMILLDNLQSYVDITLAVDKEGNITYVERDQDNNAILPGPIDQVTVTDLMAKEGSFAIPAVNYVSGDMTWTAGLPTGTVLKAKVVSNDSEHAYAGESVNSLTVEDVPGGMVVECVPDGENTADGPDGSTLMNANGVVTIKPAEGALVGPEDWVRLTTGGVAHYYKADGFALGAGTMDATGTLQLSLSDLQTLAGGSAWYGDNPTQGLTITAQAVDDVNHNIESDSDTQSAAFDTAAVADTPQSIENRAESVTIVLAEKVKENTVTVAGNFGGSTPTITSNNTETLTWENVTEWKNYPETLPHSGDVITITYKDMVGNEGTHVMNVVKSAAVVSNTLFVQPITDGTVPAKALRFYGDTNVWEQGYLTVGGTTFTVSPIPGGSPYSNSETQWQQVVTLSDINFPVGTPTTVSMAYDDLLGGDAAISITYKNEAQTPVMGSEAVVGSEALWGYVESGATVSAAVYHADGTVTQVPQSNIAVDQFGYFYIRLDQPLASGDQVVISTSDFCGNQKSITLSVQAELKSGAKAELLGANIVGKLMTDQQTYHRFATPVDLGALNAAENKSMTLPILAYKGIEIGKMTISLNSQGKMDLKYSITAGSYIPQGAHASLNTYTVKPDINALVLDEHPVVVKDLKTALNGSMPSVDVSGYQNADGGYGGVIWLQAQFDIDMTEDNYTSRGGRDVRFYRWLTESLQTEDVLGAVYQETLAYDENMTYYSTYQRFESISRQF